MDYKQCDVDHIIFYWHNHYKVAIVIVCVDDIIIISDDIDEIGDLKTQTYVFEVKDLSKLSYLLGILLSQIMCLIYLLN